MLRLAPRVAVVALILTVAATPARVAASPEDDLAAKRAAAERLEADIAANGERISMLDEDFNEARLVAEQAAADMAAAEAALADAASHADELEQRVAARAAQLYIQAGSAQAGVLDVENLHELGARSTYGSAAAASDRALLDNLGAAQDDLARRHDELEQTGATAEAQQAAIAGMRDELERLQSDQEALLGEVEGEIATLVAEIEARRRAEEEARARRELQRRIEAEHAAARARATTTTTTKSPTTTSGARTPATTPRQPPTAPAAAPAPNANAQVAVDTALAQVGKPYRYAADGPSEFDCSGLTMYAWASAGVSIPHSSRAQYAALPKVAMEDLAPGDLVFYGDPIHHVGIFIGNGQYVHAPQTGDVVKVSSIYRSDYAGAVRPG